MIIFTFKKTARKSENLWFWSINQNQYVIEKSIYSKTLNMPLIPKYLKKHKNKKKHNILVLIGITQYIINSRKWPKQWYNISRSIITHVIHLKTPNIAEDIMVVILIYIVPLVFGHDYVILF